MAFINIDKATAPFGKFFAGTKRAAEKKRSRKSENITIKLNKTSPILISA